MKVRLFLIIVGVLIFSGIGSGAQISNCTEISAPGVYYLTRNITYTDPGGCIIINSSNVVLDGQGYAIIGGHMSGYGVFVMKYNTNTNITVRNIVFSNWRGLYAYGIVFGADYGVLENVKLLSARISVTGKNNTLKNITAYKNSGVILGSYNIMIDSYFSNSYLNINGHCNLDNVTIKNASTGLSVRGNHNIVQNSRFIGNSNYGIIVSGDYNLLKNNIVSYNSWGISVTRGSDNNVIEGNTISYNKKTSISTGIYIAASNNNTLKNNNIYGNSLNLNVECYYYSSKFVGCYHNIDTTNLVDGKPVYYLLNVTNYVIPIEAGVVYIINGNNIVVNDLVIEKNYKGLAIIGSENVVVTNVTVRDNYYGIILDKSSNITIKHSNISNSLREGILTNQKLAAANFNIKIENSTFLNNGGQGTIYLKKDQNVTIKNVRISGGLKGIYLSQTKNVVITNSIICDTNSRGLYIDSLSNNIVAFNNTFCRNKYAAIDVSGDSNSIANNTVHSVTYGRNLGTGILVEGGASWNEIKNNAIYNVSDGIVIKYNDNIVMYNRISNVVSGITLYGSDNNIIHGNVINNASFSGIVLKTGADLNKIENNTVFDSSYGIYIYNTKGNEISANVFNNITKYDIFLDVMQDAYCDINISNNMGTGGEKIIFINSSKQFTNEKVSMLILCNADNSTINNITVVGNGILAVLTDNTGFSEISSSGTNGIYLLRSNFNNVSNSSFVNTKNAGIKVENSLNNVFVNTTVMKNVYGIELLGSSHNYIQVFAFENTKGVYIGKTERGYCGVNNWVDNSTIFNNTYGVQVDCTNNAVINSKILNNTYGVHILTYKKVLVENNSIGLNKIGVNVFGDNHYISNNFIFKNRKGIILNTTSRSNSVDHNIIKDNEIGLYLKNSDFNIIINNTVVNSSYVGIILVNSEYNNIINNIFNNTDNHLLLATGYRDYKNTWNATKQVGTNIIGGIYLAGNYWAKPDGTGFSQLCNDTNLDGICDEAYVLDENNVDYLPLSSVTPKIRAVLKISDLRVRINESGEIPVILDTSVDILRMNFTVAYNSSVLEIMDYNKSVSATAITEIDNANGTAKISLEFNNSVFGNVTIGYIVVKAKSKGISDLNISEIDILSKFFNISKIEVVNGSVIVIESIKGDLNGDDKVDITDVVNLAYMLIGKTKKDLKADFNNNGRIDIGDLAKLAYYVLGKVNKL